MDSNFEIEDEIRLINHLIDKYCMALPSKRLSDIKHYFGVGENETTFEYIFLELLERDISLHKGEAKQFRELGLHLKMDENDWNDCEFWQKFEAYLSKQSY